MSRRKTRRTGARRGIALLVALCFLALFACLAVAVAASADMNMAVARNRLNSEQAAALAETGLMLVQRQLGGMTLPSTHYSYDIHHAIDDRLESAWLNSTMLNADAITHSWSGVGIPTISLTMANGRTGTVDLAIEASGGALDNTTVTITSVGRFRNAVRTIRYNMTVQRGGAAIFDYGIASKSAIVLTGNPQIRGANRPAEGNIMSATYSATNAIQMTGNCHTDGDVIICNPEGKLKRTGNIDIDGSVTIGAQEPEWPEVDITPFKAYATNVYSGNGSGNFTLSNIRIPPNTNPNFSGNATLYGVIYIQAPNKVSFSGNTTLIGCIVTDTPAVDNLSANQIKFTGNLATSGVENLPAGSQYDGLRDLKGSFILAPGFSTQFSGNFSTVNGCMVASEFKFTGNAIGTVKGGIVNLRDSSFQVTGNAILTIDRDNAVPNPAGLNGSYTLVCVSGSYSE